MTWPDAYEQATTRVMGRTGRTGTGETDRDTEPRARFADWNLVGECHQGQQAYIACINRPDIRLQPCLLLHHAKTSVAIREAPI